MTERLLTRPARAPAASADRWLEALPIPVLGVAQGGRVRFANAAAAGLFAVAGRGLVGRRLDEIFGPDAPVVRLAGAALSSPQTLSAADVPVAIGMVQLARVDVAIAPTEDHSAVVISLTPRGRAQSALPTRPVSAAARTLAHEVRNPLAGIRAAAQLIGRSADADTQPLTELICAEVDRIRRLTDRIDSLDGMPPPRLAPVNVHEALERVRAMIASSFPRVAVKERYDPSLPAVVGDLDQLIQAFLNLAKNAAEAAETREAPQVVFSTSFRLGQRVRSGPVGQSRAQLEVAIEDNGPGLPPTMQERMFEPFVTTKRGGMGLGLAVTTEIIARHDGRIEAESAPGRTIFRVVLPIARLEGGQP